MFEVRDIRKNSDNFSFISTFFDLVGNKEFKSAEVSTMYSNQETKNTSIWRALSAISEDFGTEFYDNTLNFIDNVDNLNVCKVKALQSIVDMFGIKCQILKQFNEMPVDIQKIIDVFSIKKEFLIKPDVVCSSFINSMASAIVNDEKLSILETSCENLNDVRSAYQLENPDLSGIYTGNLSCESYISSDALDELEIEVLSNLLLSKLG